jgi:uncharacterized protein
MLRWLTGVLVALAMAGPVFAGSRAPATIHCALPPTWEAIDFGDHQKARLALEPGREKTLRVRLADTPQEQQRGLMFTPDLADDEGMLFVFHDVSHRSFWMENTCISLDLIFINEWGKVVHIARDAEPFSRDPIPSLHPARAVLEVRAGLADAWGLEPGARLYHPAILAE